MTSSTQPAHQVFDVSPVGGPVAHGLPGPEPSVEIPEDATAQPDTSSHTRVLPPCLPLSTDIDHGLAVVVDAWEGLPVAQRDAVLLLVRSTHFD